MARAWIEDLWFTDVRDADRRRVATKRHGRGLQWRVRWFDDQQRLRSKAFRTKREAEAWQARIEHELRDGTYRDRSLGEVRFAVVAEEWIAARTDITLTSQRIYRAALDRYLIPKWGPVPVARIRRSDLATWFAQLSEGLSPRYVAGIHRVLAMVLGWAIDTDRITANPAARLPLPRPSGDQHVFLTHAEVERLAAAAGRDRALILTLAYTGLRFGEAAALQVASVDLTGRRLSITQAWAGLNTGAPYLSLPKTHERRKVGLPPFLVDELAPIVTGRHADEWLFTAPYGGILNLSNWNRRVFTPAVRAAGFADRGLTPHSLRHTAASLAIAAGADVKVVQNMLGHKDAAMTLNTYAGLFPDRLDEVATALDTARQSAVNPTHQAPTPLPSR